jgi:hypothetical protein
MQINFKGKQGGVYETNQRMVGFLCKGGFFYFLNNFNIHYRTSTNRNVRPVLSKNRVAGLRFYE